MLTTRLVTAGTVGVLAFSLAACGGSSSSNAKGASTVPSTTASASATSSGDATPLTKEQLQKVVLQQADVPAGRQPADSSGDSGGSSDSELAACVGQANTDSDQAADISADFQNATSQIHSEATSFKHAASIDNDRKVIASPKLPSCVQKLMQEAVQGDDSGGQLTIKDAKVSFDPPTNGPDGYLGAVHGSLTAVGPAKTVPFFIDLYLTTQGQTELNIGTSGTTQQPPADAEAYLAKMLSRVPS